MKLEIKPPKTAVFLLISLLSRGLAAELAGYERVMGNSGFATALPGGLAGGENADASGLMRGFSASLGSSLFYDSNVGQSPDTLADPALDDFVFMLSPALQWTRGTSSWDLTLGAGGSFGENFNESEYSSTNYNLSGAAGYRAGRLKLGGSTNYQYNEGTNRYYSGVVTTSSYGVGLSADYEISSKTSLVSTFGSVWSQPEGDLEETASQSGNLSAMWRFSPLLAFGPGLGYSRASGDLQPTRTTWGPTLSADYKLSSKVSLSARGGLDFVDYDGGGSDHSFSSEINASYALNALCRLNLAVSRGVQADGALEGGFREGTNLRFSVDQRIGKVRAALGLGYEHSAYLAASGRTPRPAIDYYNADLSFSMPFFGDKASASVFARYSESVSDELDQDWKGVQTGIAIDYKF